MTSSFISPSNFTYQHCYPDGLSTREDLLIGRDRFTEVGYEDTEHYAVTKEFLSNTARVLEQPLADDEKDA